VLQMSSDPWHAPVLVFGLGGAVVACIVAGIRNFLRGSEFVTTALWVGIPLLTVGAVATCLLGREWEYQPIGEGLPGADIFLACLLVFFAVMVLAATALAASTRVGQVMTLLFCLAILMVGVTTDYVLSEAAETSLLAEIVYRHLPNFNFFWIIDAVNNEQPIPLVYAGYTAAYAALMSLAALVAGVGLFQRREVG